jgi:hypothetical protein
MANTDNAIGLMPSRMLSGAPWNGATNRYYVPATDNTITYIGAPVKRAGSADADGIATVTTATTTGDLLIGVVVSVEPTQATDAPYRLASTARYVNVCDDPNVAFEVQCNGTLTATMIGNSCDFSTPTTGTAATGHSLCEALISSVTATGDASEDFNIIGLVKRVDNTIGADAKVLVRLLNHAYVEVTPGA